MKESFDKLHKASFLRNTSNTKIKIPNLDPTYSEDTIYLSFIKYSIFRYGIKNLELFKIKFPLC